MINFEVIDANTFWAVPLVIAIVQMFKVAGFSKKYIPFISLLVGVGLSFLINIEMLVREIMLAGVVYGLSASGLYSNIKNTNRYSSEIAQDLKSFTPQKLVEDFKSSEPVASGVSVKREEVVEQTVQSSNKSLQ